MGQADLTRSGKLSLKLSLRHSAREVGKLSANHVARA